MDPKDEFERGTGSPAGNADVSADPEAFAPCGLDDLSADMRGACAAMGWQRLMPVQSRALPYLLAGRDMMIQSRTGSGKTGAYLLPMLSELDRGLSAPQALVLVPTRELALQVEHEASSMFGGFGMSVAAVYGGVGYAKQLEALRGGVQVVIGTPGRVLDHLLRRTLRLDDLRVLIFDEADRMLSIGFYPDMKEIQRYLPKRRVHSSLFSATYPPYVLRLAEEFLEKPEMLSLSEGTVHVATTEHYFCECRPMDKDRALVRIIETENPDSAIIFCNTKANVHYVTAVLKGFGYNADELSADLAQARREEVLKKLRAGGVRFLVATDVAARGIDIPALSHVFLYEPPEDRESYIHRAGRTGRAGAAGTVISLVDIMQRLELGRIAKYYKIDIREMRMPADEDVARVAEQRVTALLEAKKRLATGLQRERAARFLPMVRALSGEGAGTGDDDAAALLALLVDDFYQASIGGGARILPEKTVRWEPAGGGEERPGKKKRKKHKRRDAEGGGQEPAANGAGTGNGSAAEAKENESAPAAGLSDRQGAAGGMAEAGGEDGVPVKSMTAQAGESGIPGDLQAAGPQSISEGAARTAADAESKASSKPEAAENKPAKRRASRQKDALAESAAGVEDAVAPKPEASDAKPAKRSSGRGKKTLSEPVADAEDRAASEPETAENKPAKRRASRQKDAPAVSAAFPEDGAAPNPEAEDAKPAKRSAGRGRKASSGVAGTEGKAASGQEASQEKPAKRRASRGKKTQGEPGRKPAGEGAEA